MKKILEKHKFFCAFSFIWVFASLPFAENFEEDQLGCGAACFIFSWWLFLAPVWMYAIAIFLNIRRESAFQIVRKTLNVTKLMMPVFFVIFFVFAIAYGFDTYDHYRQERKRISEKKALIEDAVRHLEGYDGQRK